MPWGGSPPNQVFSRTDGVRTGTTTWQQAEAATVPILSSAHDVHDQDIANGVSACLKKDGGNQPSADLPMGGYKHTGCAAASSGGQYVEYNQWLNRVASDIQAGLIELATNTETQTGTDATRAVTPAGLRACTATDLRPGVVELATDAETAAGTDTTRAVTPANIASILTSQRRALMKQSVVASGASLAIDLASGWCVALSLQAGVTSVSVSNWPASGTFCRLLLEVSNTGAFGVAGWPAGTIWTGGVAPTITSGAGKKDTIMLTSHDGGATIRGYVVAQNMS